MSALSIQPASSLHPRYRLLDLIGRGGMGEVWRARDRLTNQVVALKRVRVPVRGAEQSPAADEMRQKTSLGQAATMAPEVSPLTSAELARTMAGSSDGPRKPGATSESSPFFELASHAESVALRLHLTQEFRTLASLRHPHIVSVLDYGFDRDRHPYFTMELHEDATPLDQAARGQPLAMQVELLLQTLQALTYLHRRGILHRDLKPGNVLIVKGPRGPQVKVLDFGLALLSSAAAAGRAQVAGTLGYIAPEIFLGAQASAASDLFAVGVMAHQLLRGTHPLGARPTADFLQEMLGTAPLFLDDAQLGAATSAVLRRALCRDPGDRYQDAAELGRELAHAVGLQPLAESTEIRESFLQAATFVARDKELGKLRHALDEAAAGHGSVWLVGGESGVGKSRLLDELRTLALVHGASVLRGQAVSAGGGAYQVWQGALRPLCLDASIDDLDASVLRGVVPDIATLIDRPVFEAPVVDAQNAQARFLAAVERLLISQPELLVLLLEDLQWAEPASLALLQHLVGVATQRRLLIIANYRQDERPTLSDEISGARFLPLRRLSAGELKQLSTSMLGEQGQRPELMALLERETEGNVFFVVEVLRALAEEAGQLSDVGQLRVSGQVVTGGIQAVILRRLGRVPEEARPLLRCAATAGRSLDLAVLRSIFPRLDASLGPCADVAVLEVEDQAWRFAHDKLREALLRDIADDEQRQLHGQIATAIEAVYPDREPHATKLAFHYQEAGNERKAAAYGALAGERAVQQGALKEAVTLLQPALSTQKANHVSPRETMRTRRFLSDALFGLGRSKEVIEHLEEAVGVLGIPMPNSSPAQVVAMLRQAAEQALRRMGGAALFTNSRSEWRALVAEFLPMLRNAEAYLYLDEAMRGMYMILLGINLAEAVGDLPQQVVGHISISYFLSMLAIPALSDVYQRLAIDAAAVCSDARAKTDLLRVMALQKTYTGPASEVQRLCESAEEGAVKLGDMNLQAFALMLEQGVAHLRGDYARACEIFARSRELMRRGINIDYGASFLLTQAQLELQRGATRAAETLILETVALGIRNKVTTPRLKSLYAQCALRLKDPERAKELADEAWIDLRSMPAVAPYLIDSHAQILDVYLHYERTAPSAKARQRIAQVLRHLWLLARAIPVGQPALDLYRGRSAWQRGRPAVALRYFHDSLQAAVRLDLAHNEALAHAWLGRLLRSHTRPAAVPDNSALHIEQALRIFKRLGAAWDLQELLHLSERFGSW